MLWFSGGWVVRPQRRKPLAFEHLEHRHQCAADVSLIASGSGPDQEASERAVMDQVALDYLFTEGELERFWDDG